MDIDPTADERAAKRFKREMRNGLMYWTEFGLGNKPASPDAPEKIANEERDKLIAEKAQIRSTQCWCWDCDKPAAYWVKVVQFDLRHPDARVDSASVDSSDYDGPIPGFCWAHESRVSELAQAVYASRPEMQWGFRPTRWFAIFTDGTKVGGETLSIAPEPATPTVTDELLQSD